MKKITLVGALLSLCVGLFAHAGHDHGQMSNDSLLVHLLWILVPLVIGAVSFVVLKKAKKVRH